MAIAGKSRIQEEVQQNMGGLTAEPDRSETLVLIREPSSTPVGSTPRPLPSTHKESSMSSTLVHLPSSTMFTRPYSMIVGEIVLHHGTQYCVIATLGNLCLLDQTVRNAG